MHHRTKHTNAPDVKGFHGPKEIFTWIYIVGTSSKQPMSSNIAILKTTYSNVDFYLNSLHNNNSEEEFPQVDEIMLSKVCNMGICQRPWNRRGTNVCCPFQIPGVPSKFIKAIFWFNKVLTFHVTLPETHCL